MTYEFITFDKNKNDNDCKNISNGNCEYCGTKNISLVKKLCDLCLSIMVYDRDNAYKTIYLKSELSQKIVIQKTVSYYKKYGTIPSPHQLDPNVQRLDISSVQLKYLMFNNKLNKDIVDKNGIVAFFNIEFCLKNIIPLNVFLKQKILLNKTYWSDIEKLNIFKISKLLHNNTTNNNLNIIEKSKISLQNKINRIK
jgi:hypothetical protein